MIRSKSASIPYIIWMVIFMVFPLGLVAYYALTDAEGNFTIEYLGQIGQYTNVFARSIWLAVIATIICLILAFPLSFMISRLSGSKQTFMLMLVILPMWMNFLLRTYSWMSLLEKNGIINKALGLIGIGPFDMINTQGAVVLGMVYNYLPFMILPIYSIMTKIDKSVIEAAQDLGANAYQITTKILIPLSAPGISTGIIMVFVPSISTFIISRMLGGGGNLLIGDLIEMQFLGNAYNPHLGSAMSVIMMVIVLLCMSVSGILDNDDVEDMLV